MSSVGSLSNQSTGRSAARGVVRLGLFQLVVAVGFIGGCLVVSFFLGYLSGQTVGYDAAAEGLRAQSARIPVALNKDSAEVEKEILDQVYNRLKQTSSLLPNGESPQNVSELLAVMKAGGNFPQNNGDAAGGVPPAPTLAAVPQVGGAVVPPPSHGAPGQPSAKGQEHRVAEPPRSSGAQRSVIEQLGGDLPAGAIPTPIDGAKGTLPAGVRVLGGAGGMQGDPTPTQPTLGNLLAASKPEPPSVAKGAPPKAAVPSLAIEPPAVLHDQAVVPVLPPTTLATTQEEIPNRPIATLPSVATTTQAAKREKEERPRPTPAPTKVVQGKQSTSGEWYAQVAAPKDESDARSVVSRLRASGFQASIERAMIQGTPYYRVVVGPEDSRELATRLVDQLRRESYIKGVPFIKQMK